MKLVRHILFHRISYIIFCLLGFGGLFWVILFLDPDFDMYFPYSSLLFLCVALFVSFFFLFQLLFARGYVSLLAALFVVSNVVLRYFGFGDYLYTLILFVLFTLVGILLFGNSKKASPRDEVKRRVTRRRVIRDGAQK